MKHKVEYIIEPSNCGDYILYSVVPTSFGGAAKNFVCRGSKEYCLEVKDRFL